MPKAHGPRVALKFGRTRSRCSIDRLDGACKAVLAAGQDGIQRAGRVNTAVVARERPAPCGWRLGWRLGCLARGRHSWDDGNKVESGEGLFGQHQLSDKQASCPPKAHGGRERIGARRTASNQPANDFGCTHSLPQKRIATAEMWNLQPSVISQPGSPQSKSACKRHANQLPVSIIPSTTALAAVPFAIAVSPIANANWGEHPTTGHTS